MDEGSLRFAIEIDVEQYSQCVAHLTELATRTRVKDMAAKMLTTSLLPLDFGDGVAVGEVVVSAATVPAEADV